MQQRKRRFQDFERFITLLLAVATVIFIAFLSASGSGNIALKVVYTILIAGDCGYCLWLLYKKSELLRRRSFWMTVWASAIIICTLAAIILNFPSPNLYG